MKNRFYLIVAVFLCIGAGLLIRQRIASASQREATTQENHPSDKYSSQIAPFTPSESDSKTTSKSGQPLKKATSINNVRRLQEIGYVITADRIDERSAEGSLKILAPDGTVITGNKLSFSPQEELFFVTEDIKLVTTKERRQLRMESTSSEASLQIDPVKGTYNTSPTGWKFGSKTIP